MMNAAAPEGTPPRRIKLAVLGEFTNYYSKNFLTFPCPKRPYDWDHPRSKACFSMGMGHIGFIQVI